MLRHTQKCVGEQENAPITTQKGDLPYDKNG